MEEEQKKDTESNPDDLVIPPSATTEYVDEYVAENLDIKNAPLKKDTIDKEPVQVIVNVPKEDNKTAISANKIAIFGTLINAVLAGLTFMLFQKTVEANRISQLALTESTRANDISTQALKDSRKADSISVFKDSVISAFNERQYLNGREKDSITISITRKSLESQINSLRESQKQFQIENLAYIECSDFNFASFESNKEPKIAFKIQNVGRVPVKVMGFKLGFFYRNTIGFNPDGYLKTLAYESIPTTFYITKETPRIQFFTAYDKISALHFDAVSKGVLALFFCGEIKYVNEMNGKKMKYIFNALLNPPPSIEHKMVFLNNIEDVD